MRLKDIHDRIAPLALVLGLSLLLPSLAHAQLEQSVQLGGDHLVLVDLIGEVRVEGHAGSQFEIQVQIKGEDAVDGLLTVESEEESGESRLFVRFPVEDEQDYVYPRMGRGSQSSFRFDPEDGDNGWMSQLFSTRRKIEVQGSGRGLEVWADVTVLVPANASCEVYLGCGSIEASNVNGALRLDTHVGGINVDGVEGAVLADTGSGHVELSAVNGDVEIDTGSGHVDVDSVKGELNVDTGSGHVEVRAVEGDRVEIDTGSGHVRVQDVVCKRLVVDTGSGGVQARRLSADEVRIDTGSGGIDLTLDAMGTGEFELDTGSGSIELTLPQDASARIEGETGGGRISVDLEGATIERMERDYVRLTVGEGTARVTMDTGSGGIRISY